MIYVFVGAGVALGVLALDVAIDESALPGWLRVGPDLAQAALVALVTSLLFVVSVVFWVRIWAVQMSAQPVLSRVLTQFLTDTVQRHSMGAIIGVMAYVLTVLHALPQEGAGMESVPHLAVTLSFVMALAVAVTIVFAVDNAARWGQVGQLIHQITSRSVESIRVVHPPLGDSLDEEGDRQQPPEAWQVSEVPAHDSGWVRQIDEQALLQAVPPGATIDVAVRVGDFAFEGAPLVRVWTEESVEDVYEQVQAAVTIGYELSVDADPVGGIRELVDIAERAMTASNSDTTTARSAVLHVGVVLRELMLRDLPGADHVDEQGRRLLHQSRLGLAGYLDVAFGRLRELATDSAALTDALLTVIAMLIEQIADRDLPGRQALLRDHAEAILQVANERAELPETLANIAPRAR